MHLIKAELHCHTSHSKDGLDSVETLIKFAKMKGVKCLAITDHNTINALEEAKKLGKKHNIIILSGEEVRTKEGDVLVYGVDKEIRKGISLKKLVRLAHSNDYLLFAPHPYAILFHSLSSLHSNFDPQLFHGFEVFNARTYFSNYKTLYVAKNHNLTKIATSDAHSAKEIGNSYTILKVKDLSEESVIDALKSNSVHSLHFKRTPLEHMVLWYFKRFVF